MQCILVAFISILSGLFGGALSLTAGVADAVSSPYMAFDAAGDLTWTDPATGVKYQYTKTKDGTYTHPTTGEDVTAEELSEITSYREKYLQNEHIQYDAAGDMTWTDLPPR